MTMPRGTANASEEATTRYAPRLSLTRTSNWPRPHACERAITQVSLSDAASCTTGSGVGATAWGARSGSGAGSGSGTGAAVTRLRAGWSRLTP
jgi:hypothetical protein